MSIRRLSAVLFALVAVTTMQAPSRAETINCTHVTTLPAVISTPGVYCLTGALNTAMTSGIAIDIQANSVVLDLNGFMLKGLGAGPGTTAVGIHAQGRRNVTIRNGIVRGFFAAIGLEGDTGDLVEDIQADQNTSIGIFLSGARGDVRNNLITTTGGTTQVGPNSGVAGIVIKGGAGIRVLNNDIAFVDRGGTSASAGIAFDGGINNFAVNNRISAVTDYGILFVNGGTGKYRDNLTESVATPYSGGTDAGNNN